MSRIRSIKPTHWNDKQLQNISFPAHLLWIGTWNFSDDKGVFENDPFLLKSEIFPRRKDVRIEQVSQWLDQLEKARFIIPFDYNEESYYINRTFSTHQRIDKPQKSKIPTEVIEKVLKENSQNIPRTFPPDSIGKDSIGEDSPPFVNEKTFDAEESILKNQIQFEKICMSAGKNPETARAELRKFHLYLQEKDRYPHSLVGVFAGFEKWLLNSKNYGTVKHSNERIKNSKSAGAYEYLERLEGRM